MKKLIVSSVLAFITFSAQAAAFQVTSNEIKTGEQLTTSHVFSGFGCEGGNSNHGCIPKRLHGMRCFFMGRETRVLNAGDAPVIWRQLNRHVLGSIKIFLIENRY